MLTSVSVSGLAAAFAKAQGDFPVIPKGKTAKAGPYSYDYADLADMIAALQPVLAANGLCVMQDAGCDTDKDGAIWVHVSTTVMHSSGEWFSSSPLTIRVVENKPQAIGIATTYARRYSYGATLGVSPEADTDGQSDHPVEAKPRPTRRPTPPATEAPAQKPAPPAKVSPSAPALALWNEATKEFGALHVKAKFEAACVTVFGTEPKPTHAWTADDASRVHAVLFQAKP